MLFSAPAAHQGSCMLICWRELHRAILRRRGLNKKGYAFSHAPYDARSCDAAGHAHMQKRRRNTLTWRRIRHLADGLDAPIPDDLGVVLQQALVQRKERGKVVSLFAVATALDRHDAICVPRMQPLVGPHAG
eukprot:365123-Chlamydomonas_euryale.AAC.21